MKDIFNKRQRFSIRKFSVGVASVLIGVALFTPSQGVLASTENSLPSVEKREAVQPISDNQNNPSSELDTRDVPIGSTRTTESGTSGDKENNSLTTRDFVAGEDRSSTPAVRATSNPSEVKKYELTDEYAKQIKAGVIGSEGNKLDSLLLNGPTLSPEAYTDNDYLKDKEELYIYEKGGKKYVGYNSHPMLEDTDGDGIIDSKEKPDEKLKWNVSERDMIMFMELSYRDDDYIDKVLNHKKQLTEADLYKKKGESKPRYEYMMMNRELAPYWKRKKSYHTSSGLDAVLYETKSDFLYLPNGTAQVLAFRGTSDAKDIVADGVLGVGSNPQQGNDAENIMRELAKDKSITNLYLTGHSLGGYLVQRAMVEAYQLAYSDSRVMSPKEQRAYRNFYNNVLKKGTTFNAPKVVTSWVSSREFWQKGLDSKKIAQSGKMTHYIVDNDSTIRKGVSNDSDVVINVGPTSGGHSSRSYFENDLINRRPEFISGKRISLDGTGYQDKKITTVKSVEKVGETTVYSKRGDDIIKSTTVSMKDPDTGQITKNTIDEMFKKDGVKDKVEVETIPSPVKYEKDASRDRGQENITVAGKAGSKTTTTTYTVNPNTGEAIAHVGQPVVEQPAIETVVKVAAKDEVEYIKKGADVVKKTTSYTVNSKTGSLTSTEKEEVVNKGGAKDIVEYNSVEPKPVYLKDENSPKGTDTVQFPGKSGKTKVTTTYSVNPVNGTLTPSKGEPEVVTLPIARVVKVGAKDKVEVETIPSPVKYEKDTSREKGQDNITISGKAGSKTTTTTYTVNPNNGEVTPHVGEPVVVNPTNTIIKVAAKDKIVYSKDGDNIVKEVTTYTVNPTNGNITEHTAKEMFKENGLKDKVDVETIPSPVKYEKDTSRDRGQDNITVPGKAGSKTTTTTYTVNPNSGEAIAHVGEPVIVNPTTTIIKVAAKDEAVTSKDGNNIVKTATSYTVNPDNGNIIEHTTKETFKENGLKDKVEVETIPSPVKYEKDASRDRGQDNITVAGKDGSKTTTTTYTVNPDNGEVTPNEGNPVIVNPTETIVKVAAKDKVVETPIEPEMEYVKNVEKDFGTPDQRTEGERGKIVTTTTYDVDPNDGHITEHVGNPVVTPAGKTIVQVGAKTKVEQTKDSEGRDVIDTTTYEVDPKTGKVTPTTVRTYGITKEPKNETRPVPSPVVYEKDDTKEKGTAPTTVKGEDGEDTITTTYTVDSNTGKITASEGQSVRTKEPTNTIVKVPAKDKVVETPIEPEVEYVKDVEKDFGTPDQRTEGEKGKTVTTTTYDVDSTDGHITEYVGTPVVTPAGKTIVKVGAKTKVERNKDDQGRDVIDTTTYEVDPKTGQVTPTTVRTYGKTKEPKVELEQDPKAGDDTATPKKQDGSTYPLGTKVEILGEDGKGKVPNSDIADVEKPGTGKITEPGKPAVEVPVENPAKVTIFENGVLPASIELPELMIEIRWIDEDGNVLKPSLKTGSEKDAEHGLISGYEFVRTVISENEPVITHIFRKVSSNTNTIPVTPDTNGNTGPDTSALTTPIPVAPVTPDANGDSGYDTATPTTPIPDEVAPNANHEDTTNAIDNGVKSKDSQNVLPNTGTESNETLASLGLLGMLSGLGLALGKKKED